MKKIIVAGGSGFLGEFLLKNFKKKYDTVSLSKSKSINAKENYICNFLVKNQLINCLKKIKKKYVKLDCFIFVIGSSKKNNDDLELKIKTNLITFKNLLDSYCRIFNFNPIKIIVISSIVTEKIILDAPLEYTVSKAALKSYALCKAKELASKKININIISPGNILIEGNNWSKRLKKNKKNTMKYIKNNVPINNFVDGSIIFNTCEMLINDKDNFYTGNNFILDGGQSL